MTKEMLINHVRGQQCRIAIVSNDVLEELYIERSGSASQVGSIYKARVVNIEPSIQAAFVDYQLRSEDGGFRRDEQRKNGFLHISDLNQQYFPGDDKSSEPVGKKRRHHQRPPIQQCLRKGQEIVVQMTKEGIGTKGPTMTTYLSIPGRFLVLMPGMKKLGVSRKIEDESVRENAKKILADLNPPDDMGFIVRTAGQTAPKRRLKSDLNYLLRLWKSVEARISVAKAPSEIYTESDLVTRTLRDIYDTDIKRIICDDKSVAMKIREFLKMSAPRGASPIELYTGENGLFQDFGLETEIEKTFSRSVDLSSGGSLVIDQTEALVAIDVNSGKYREQSNPELTALNTNILAAEEVARQLRLRDMGGVIVIDFIDMREDVNQRKVEKTLKDAIKNDRARTKLARISAFGLLEMTRQRMRQSLKDSESSPCPICSGTGKIKSAESQALIIMRHLQSICANPDATRVEVTVADSVAHHLSNFFREQIGRMEAENSRQIIIHAKSDIAAHEATITYTNDKGSVVSCEIPPKPIRRNAEKKRPETIPLDDTIVPVPKRPRRKTASIVNDQAGETSDDQDDTNITAAVQDESAPTKKKTRRGKRGGRRHRKTKAETADQQNDTNPSSEPAAPEAMTPAELAGIPDVMTQAAKDARSERENIDRAISGDEKPTPQKKRTRKKSYRKPSAKKSTRTAAEKESTPVEKQSALAAKETSPSDEIPKIKKITKRVWSGKKAISKSTTKR